MLVMIKYVLFGSNAYDVNTKTFLYTYFILPILKVSAGSSNK